MYNINYKGTVHNKLPTIMVETLLPMLRQNTAKYIGTVISLTLTKDMTGQG